MSFELLVKVIFIPVIEPSIVTPTTLILYIILLESNNTHKETITAPTVPNADNPLNIKIKISF